MRALILLVLLLALIALFSFHEPLIPYWKNRFPAVMSCLDEGRYSDALAAAMAGNVPSEKSTRWPSEPLGEAAPDAHADSVATDPAPGTHTDRAVTHTPPTSETD